MALRDGIYLRLIVQELPGRRREEPIMELEDSQPAIGFVHNNIISDRTKHIDVNYHLLYNRVQGVTVKVHYPLAMTWLAC